MLINLKVGLTIVSSALVHEPAGIYSVEVNRRSPAFTGRTPRTVTGASDMSVEQPTKFKLVINQKTGKQIGLTIPQNVLARANQLIR